ncbi:MAG TPA: NAD-dependent epimerase/dehydratase family protein [Solirubrobacterales bacterium]
MISARSNGHGPPRRTLVAGAGGFIGGHLVRALLERGEAVRAVDIKPTERWMQLHPEAENIVADLSRREACEEAVQGVDRVFNLAADMGGIGFISTHKADCMLSVLINTHLLLAARDAGVERYFYASSACVYPVERQASADVVPLREDQVYPAMPEDGYGWEKLFGERMCRHFREDYGLETRVGRYHNVYGPFGDYDGGREKAPAAICRKVATAVLTETNTIEIWGDGRQTRSFMYIDDCIEGTLRLMDSDYPDPVNIGSSELVTIDELVDIVESIADARLERIYDTSAPQGVRGRNSDNELVREVLGWEPRISLTEGLERTYRWIEVQVARTLSVEPSANGATNGAVVNAARA